MANCIKCGKELVGNRVFCDECQEVMKQYPVPAGTPLVIQPRRESKKTAAKKKVLSAEEQAAGLRKLLRWMALGMVALMVTLCVVVGLLLKEWSEPNPEVTETKGQNYSTQHSTGGK